MGIELRLKHLRKDRGYTQESFAQKLGVPVGTYRNWEQGINSPDNDTIIRIVKLLETSSDYLFGRIDYDLSDMSNSPHRKYLLDKIAKGTPEQLRKLDRLWDIIVEEDENNT